MQDFIVRNPTSAKHIWTSEIPLLRRFTVTASVASVLNTTGEFAEMESLLRKWNWECQGKDLQCYATSSEYSLTCTSIAIWAPRREDLPGLQKYRY